MPKATHTRDADIAVIHRAVEHAATRCGINPPHSMLAQGRGADHLADARGLAMAVACAAGVPPFIVAQAFRRDWKCVDAARHTQMRRCRESQAHRDLFISVLYRSLEP